MGIPIGGGILYTHFLADDQVIIAGEINDSSYMLCKLKVEYEKWGLIFNIKNRIPEGKGKYNR